MTVFDSRCPWQAVCRCTHTVCVRGWLPDQPGFTTEGNESKAVARRCPVCDAARQQIPYIPPRDVARVASGEKLDEWETVQ